MKQIILLRHAKVDIDDTQKMNATALKNWVEAYDMANIHPQSLPTQELRSLVNSADVIVTSSLRRAIDSAKVLGVDIYKSNAIFNEANIPNVNISFFKFKPKMWLVILRVLLLFGLGKKDASLKASKQQAKEGSKRLLELSNLHETVVLVGHGGMNWLLRKELMHEGWAIESKPSNKYWGLTVLKLEKTKE